MRFPRTLMSAEHDQMDALKAGLDGTPVVLIQGPPGTGKTRTILNLLSVVMHSARKVLGGGSRHAWGPFGWGLVKKSYLFVENCLPEIMLAGCFGAAAHPCRWGRARAVQRKGEAAAVGQAGALAGGEAGSQVKRQDLCTITLLKIADNC